MQINVVVNVSDSEYCFGGEGVFNCRFLKNDSEGVYCELFQDRPENPHPYTLGAKIIKCAECKIAIDKGE